MNPEASVVPWMDTMLVYTGWRLDGKEEKVSKNPPLMPVNTTLNPDAALACSTGHFRPGEPLLGCLGILASIV